MSDHQSGYRINQNWYDRVKRYGINQINLAAASSNPEALDDVVTALRELVTEAEKRERRLEGDRS